MLGIASCLRVVDSLAKDERRQLGQVCELVKLTCDNIDDILKKNQPGAVKSMKPPLDYIEEELKRAQLCLKGVFVSVDR